MEVEFYNTESKSVTTETGFRYLKTDSVLQSVENWEGTYDEIFTKFERENNRLRYCNGTHYKFKNKTDELNFKKWYNNLSEAEQMVLFYGNGVVD